MEPGRRAERLSSVLSRRELLRVASLGGLVVAVPTLATACSSHGGRSGGTGSVTDGAITLVSSHVARTAVDPAAAAGAAGAMQALGGALYGQLASGGGNLALSPYSVAVALGMTVNGAVGKTRDEMLAVLHQPDVETLDAGDNALTQYVESLAGTVPHSKDVIALDAANQLFGQHGVTWHKAFLDALAASFGAGLREVDYEKDAEAARKAINGWTADQTHDRIPEIIPSGVLDEGTRLVLVNTLYFKAPWSTRFEKIDTTDGDFHLTDGTTAKVPMMHDTAAAAALGGGDGWQSAQLAYAGEKLAMTLVLPDEGRLADVESLLATRPADLLVTGGAGAVDLTLPRWKFTTAAALNDPLAVLGMPTAFSDAADFSGMTSDATLFIKDVLHQVFIAVDEDGTEAAAATAVVAEATSEQLAMQTLIFDRPFLFVIHDIAHGTPLFLGRVADPRG